MSCPGKEDSIYRYLDGELSAAERSEFEAHLVGCPTCREALARAQGLFVLLNGLSAAPVPAGFASGVMAGLPSAVQPRGVTWLLAGQLVASVLCLVLSFRTLATWYEQLARWLAPGWLSERAAEASAWLENTWLGLRPELSLEGHLGWAHGWGLAWPQAALVVVALVGAWILGNRLLLVSRADITGGTQ
jgi:anti-sigma factor RsiW